ncbi:MAG: chitobiase/beta-hexosaminidase C-terminal domain-containing protein, partial [Thermodesulfobacteriota bacterium]
CATAGADIRYTLDGGEPGEASPLYSEPIAVTASAAVKARAFKPGWASSQVVLAEFIITVPAPEREVVLEPAQPVALEAGPEEEKKPELTLEPPFEAVVSPPEPEPEISFEPLSIEEAKPPALEIEPTIPVEIEPAEPMKEVRPVTVDLLSFEREQPVSELMPPTVALEKEAAAPSDLEKPWPSETPVILEAELPPPALRMQEPEIPPSRPIEITESRLVAELEPEVLAPTAITLEKVEEKARPRVEKAEEKVKPAPPSFQAVTKEPVVGRRLMAVGLVLALVALVGGGLYFFIPRLLDQMAAKANRQRLEYLNDLEAVVKQGQEYPEFSAAVDKTRLKLKAVTGDTKDKADFDLAFNLYYMAREIWSAQHWRDEVKLNAALGVYCPLLNELEKLPWPADYSQRLSQTKSACRPDRFKGLYPPGALEQADWKADEREKDVEMTVRTLLDCASWYLKKLEDRTGGR